MENYSDKISNMMVSSAGSLKDVARAIEYGCLGVALVVKPNTDQFVGIITDGDIRRYILSEEDVVPLALNILNKDPVVGNQGMDIEEINSLFSPAIRVIPILNKKNQVADLAVYDQRIHLPIAQPFITETEVKYVNDCVTSGWVSSAGKYINRFESVFKDYCGTRHAITTMNGTAALHLALVACGVGPGDEVIVPDLTFIATASTVIHAGAKPIFVDVNKDTWCINDKDIEPAITSKTKAIIPVHLYGHPANMDRILEIAKKYNLIVIEDAAESHGAEFNKKLTGTIGDVGVFSFYGNKVITTGEGGMIVTDDDLIAKRARQLRDHGMDRSKGYWHPELGFNYRMTSLQAALGVAQMEKIDEVLEKKLQIAKTYEHFLSKSIGLILPKQASRAKHIYWMYTILVEEDVTNINRDDMLKILKNEKIDARPSFIPMSCQPPFKTEKKFPVSNMLSSKGLSLPSYVGLAEDDIKRVCDVINTAICIHSKILRS